MLRILPGLVIVAFALVASWAAAQIVIPGRPGAGFIPGFIPNPSPFPGRGLTAPNLGPTLQAPNLGSAPGAVTSSGSANANPPRRENLATVTAESEALRDALAESRAEEIDNLPIVGKFQRATSP